MSTDTHETTQKKNFKKEKLATHPLAPACLHNFQNLTILPDSAELSKVPPTLPNYVPAKVNKNTFFHLLHVKSEHNTILKTKKNTPPGTWYCEREKKKKYIYNFNRKKTKLIRYILFHPHMMLGGIN